MESGAEMPQSPSSSISSPLSLESVSSRLSARRRRDASSSGSQSDETLVPIDAWIVEQETHYAAAPHPAQLPLRTLAHRSPSPLTQVFGQDSTSNSIRQIISVEGLTFESLSLINRQVTRFGVAPCFSVTVSGDRQRYTDAAFKIYALIRGLGVSSKFIAEVYNPQKMTDDTLFCISAQHPKINTLEALRDEAFNLGRRFLGRDNIGASVYKMFPIQTPRSSDAPLVETLVVWVKEDAVRDFDTLAQRLRSLVEERGDGLHVQVRLLESAPGLSSEAF